MMEPSDSLKAGRRVVDGFPGIEIESDWDWNISESRWVLGLQVKIDGFEHLPVVTSWKMLCDSVYPWGRIDVYPAEKDGIEVTFPHQLNNRLPISVPWRSGKICLNEPIAALGRLGPSTEPFSVEERLLWHVQRLVGWIQAADAGLLAKDGDRFEMPDFGSDRARIVGFNETIDSLSIWNSADSLYGTAQAVKVSRNAYAVKNFRGWKNNFKLDTSWGTVVSNNQNVERCLWIRLSSIPIWAHWDVPLTWHELRETCRRGGIEIMKLIEEMAPAIRDGEPHFLLIGFPISSVVGGAPERFHWQAVELPRLALGANCAKGFRRNNFGYWKSDIQNHFKAGDSVRWVHSENWEKQRLNARGLLAPSLCKKKCLLIGAGSLGSTLAELFARLGLESITIVDHDRLDAGNLARHTLDLESVGDRKALALSRRISRISPHIVADSFDASLYSMDDDVLDQFELIIDCTGDDGVLAFLGARESKKEQTYISLSISYGAEELFCYYSHGKSFPYSEFRTRIDPYIEREIELRRTGTLQWEGIGCWHPLFPARLDDLYALGRLAMRWLEASMTAAPVDDIFCILRSTEFSESNVEVVLV